MSSSLLSFSSNYYNVLPNLLQMPFLNLALAFSNSSPIFIGVVYKFIIQHCFGSIFNDHTSPIIGSLQGKYLDFTLCNL
jgi:hypothetical protein